MRIDDLLSSENIRCMARLQPVGDAWPYSGGAELEIESHIRRVAAALEHVRGLIWEFDFDHYGSGYASYVDAFAYRRDGHGVREADGQIERDGLRVYLSRVGPIACLGPATVTRHETGGSYDFLEPRKLDALPDETWHDFVGQVRQLIVKHGYEFIPRELAGRTLDFPIEIPTILVNGPLRVFDAAFFWED